uniref:uncharacterized protein LOC120340516 n=1 Tax=Styela clava TaxID=7725 RepID=UPI001939DAEF|nr:uncharacterized protein LOC120340516 [Styela clava]
MDVKKEKNFAKTDEQTNKSELINYINHNVIGKDAVFSGPFGIRKILYCDYIASGRPLASIEDFLQKHVLPMYGNTHTTTSVTSLQMTFFRQEARDIIRNAVRASEHDAVIFAGSGVTGSVHKLINALNFSKPPVVFCGPFEHHSNLLPWREIAFEVVRISENANGDLNLHHLEAALEEWEKVGLPMVGCFSAASNVTGRLADTVATSILLHRYGALSLWDYATAAPYTEITMHPVVANGNASKDAIFISPHKFVGGVNTPGVLVASKTVFNNPVPSDCGGGSVFFVSDNNHKYLKDEETREEGGTPDIIGSIRAGLAFKLKEDIGSKEIMKHENDIYNHVLNAWKDVQSIEILGLTDSHKNNNKKTLAVFSFMIRHLDSGLYLHYSFIAALLNDLFGIQARGGCACAGPYAQDLLGISSDKVARFEKALTEDSRLDRRHLRRFKEYSPHEVLRPGFVRLSLPYFTTNEEADFIIEAVKMIAENGWNILPNYLFNPETGEWMHVKQKVFNDRKWLGQAKFTTSGMTFRAPTLDETKGSLPDTFEKCLSLAKEVFEKAKRAPETFLPNHDSIFNKSVEDLRWFLTPSEARMWVTKSQGRKVQALPKRTPSFTVRKKITELTLEEINKKVSISEFTKEKISRILNRQESNHKTPGVNGEDNSSLHTNGQVLSKDKTDIIMSNSIPDNGHTNGEINGNDSSLQMNSCSKNGRANTPSEVKFISPPKRLFKLTVQAIEDFKMINSGDRVLVCLSGGKDSLSLLHTLRQYQFYAKKQGVDFELGAVTVDPKTESYDPSPLIEYLSALGLPYFYEEQAILDQALSLPEVTSICAFCSRMKRGRLYHCARREKWNVLAMGQHLDDLAESFLMSTFQNGLLRTMKANYTVKERDLRVIRPFIYVREKDTRDFAENSILPVIPENCPACFEAPKERHRMKQLLASQEILHPKLFYSLKEALRPLMSKNETGMESGGKNPIVLHTGNNAYDSDE